MSGRKESELDYRNLLLAKLMEDPRLVVTVGEAAEMLGVSRSFAYQLVRQSELPVIHLGRRKVVPKVALFELAGFSVRDRSQAPGEQV
jgi:excisionase family DNA binding protein